MRNCRSSGCRNMTCPEQRLQSQHQAETCSVVIYHYHMSSPALLGLSIFTGRKSWQAAGQAYIPPKQNGAHLVESSARPKGPAFLLHKEQHQHL